MSVDIETTVKTWNDVPNGIKNRMDELIQDIQKEMLQHFEVSHEWDDENDNGYFPEIDIEVHDVDDPDGSSRRLVITSQSEISEGHATDEWGNVMGSPMYGVQPDNQEDQQ